MDKISIIVPCYNVEKYISRCVKSIINQTYGIENLEIILIDDASTDNTFSIIDTFKNMYPDSIVPVRFENNRRQGAARNVGLEFARGEYITFVDADDVIAPDMIERMHCAIVEQDCEQVQCGHRDFWGGDIPDGKRGSEHFRWDLNEVDKRKNFILRSMTCIVWSRLFKRSFFDRTKLRFLEGVFFEDAHFAGMCSLLLDSFYYLDEELYYYFHNDNGTMHSQYDSKKNLEHIYVSNAIIEELKERGIYGEVQEKYGYELEAFYFWMIYINPMTMLFHEVDRQVGAYREELLQKYPDILESPYVKNITYEPYLEYLKYLKR